MKYYVIEKNTSTEIKGIAILLMLFHHIFTFPNWINYGNYTPNIMFAHYLNAPTKLCVSIFAFITGWAFMILKNKSLKAIIKKIISFIIIYWIVTISITIIAVIFCGYRPTILEYIGELLGISNILMKFCWYVPFYIVSIIIMSYLYKFLDKGIIISSIAGVFIPILIFYILSKIILNKNIQVLAESLKHWFPCIATGYICNKYNVFGFIQELIKRINNGVILFIVILFCSVGRYFVSALDFVYCAMIVFALTSFIQRDSHTVFKRRVDKIIIAFGNTSTNVWFLHCIFFSSVTRSIFQPLIYCSSNPLIIYFTALVILFILSLGFNWVNKKILLKFMLKQ